jgi:hypothetical protein
MHNERAAANERRGHAKAGSQHCPLRFAALHGVYWREPSRARPRPTFAIRLGQHNPRAPHASVERRRDVHRRLA